MPAYLNPTKPLIVGQGRTWAGSSHVVAQGIDPAIIYDDAGTISFSFAASGAESQVFTDARIVPFTLTGSFASESSVHTGPVSQFTDNADVEFVLTPLATESSVHTGSGTVAFTIGTPISAYPGAFYPGQAYPGQTSNLGTETHDAARTTSFGITLSRVEAAVFDDAGTIAFTLSGTRTESAGHTAARTAAFALAVSATEQFTQGGNVTYTDQRTIAYALGLSATESSVHTSTGTVAFTFGGTGSAAPVVEPDAGTRYDAGVLLEVGGFDASIPSRAVGYGPATGRHAGFDEATPEKELVLA